jgi:hypothetical protein
MVPLPTPGIRCDRSLRPSFCRTTASGRGSEGAAHTLSEPRAKQREALRERAVNCGRGLRGWFRCQRPGSVVTAHSGRRSAERRPSVAALKALHTRCQSRERSSAKRCGSERSTAVAVCMMVPLPTPGIRCDRSLRPSFCRTTAFGRGSEGAAHTLSEPRAKQREALRERAVHCGRGLREWFRCQRPGSVVTAHSGRRSAERRPSVAALKAQQQRCQSRERSSAKRCGSERSTAVAVCMNGSVANARHPLQPLTPAVVLPNDGLRSRL